MRLIDADALIEKRWDADTRVGYVQVVDVQTILDAPTIDAVPVVRCVECKHNRNCFIKEMIIAETKQDNPYCSCGAKIEDKP